MREYLLVIFAGLPAIFLYNYYAALLRSVGNSTLPLIFLAVSAAMNIGLDLLFVVGFQRGVAGAAEATVLSQYISGAGIMLYTMKKRPDLRMRGAPLRLARVKEIASFSALTCVQQSIMNLGILLVQGLVNSFGTTVMAAFAAAVKIERLRLHARAGLWQRLFHIHRPELRRGRRGAHARGAARGGEGVRGLQFAGFGALVAVRRGADGAVHRRGRDAIIAEGVRYLRIEARFTSPSAACSSSTGSTAPWGGRACPWC